MSELQGMKFGFRLLFKTCLYIKDSFITESFAFQYTYNRV